MRCRGDEKRCDGHRDSKRAREVMHVMRLLRTAVFDRNATSGYSRRAPEASGTSSSMIIHYPTLNHVTINVNILLPSTSPPTSSSILTTLPLDPSIIDSPSLVAPWRSPLAPMTSFNPLPAHLQAVQEEFSGGTSTPSYGGAVNSGAEWDFVLDRNGRKRWALTNEISSRWICLTSCPAAVHHLAHLIAR